MMVIATVEELIDETESLLEELLLSGFQGVHQASHTQIEELLKNYEKLGMTSGIHYVRTLQKELIKRRNRLGDEVEELVKSYSQMVFYIESCRAKM